MQVIVLLGPPGAGKGTQSKFICDVLKVPQVATGDMLRAEIKRGTAIGQTAQSTIARGQLVDDEIIIYLIKKRTSQKDCQNGFLLDGFPRNTRQAEMLNALLEESHISINKIIYFDVPDDVIVARLKNRWIHAASGRVYNLQENPPKTPGKDDLTGEPLVQREDDKEDIVRNRLTAYHQETAPLIQWYQKSLGDRFFQVSGTETIGAVRDKIIKILT